MKDKEVATERFFHGIRMNILCWPQRPRRSCYKVYLAALTHTSVWQKVRIVTWCVPTVTSALHVLYSSVFYIDTAANVFLPKPQEKLVAAKNKMKTALRDGILPF